MSLETVRISRQGRDQLITLKRRTNIEHWNVLCRWAFCLSISDPTPPRDYPLSLEGGVEMTWKTFAGEYEGVYTLLLRERCRRDGVDLNEEALAHQFRLHIHRGISHLMGMKEMKSIADFVGLAEKRGAGKV